MGVNPGIALTRRAQVALAAAAVLWASRADAWVISEHVRISRAALARLEGKKRATLDRAWTHAALRGGWLRTSRSSGWACATPFPAKSSQPASTPDYGPDAACYGFDILPALAGDHSCTPDDLERFLFDAPRLRGVLRVAESTDQVLLDPTRSPTRRVDARREMHVRLQAADDLYLMRAQQNGAHFQPLRTSDDLETYLRTVLWPGERSSATGYYVSFHTAALRHASEYARCSGAPAVGPECADHARQAFLDEAFALHFLEDSFSAGHVVGTSGNDGERMGTHDFYCRHGLEVRTWAPRSSGYVAYGDAFLSDEDENRTSDAAALSLTQLANALEPGSAAWYGIASTRGDDHVDVCTAAHVPLDLVPLASETFVKDVVALEPMPAARVPGMPAFANEVGGFLGAAIYADGLAGTHGVAARQRAGVRAGFLADGGLARYMDGRLFLEANFAIESAPSSPPDAAVFGHGALLGFGGRLHLPFMWVPGDGALIFPIALASKQPKFVNLASEAAAGGRPLGLPFLEHAERLFLLSEQVTLQVALGRDASALLYLIDGRVYRWELDAPVLVLRGEAPYAREVAAGWDIELAFTTGQTTIDDAAHLRGWTYGAALSISPFARWHP